MIVLHTYCPQTSPERTAATWRFVRDVGGPDGPRWLDVLSLPTPAGDPDAYRQALRLCWAMPGDLCVLEQDVEPTLEMLEALAACPHPVCAQAYRLYPSSTGLPAPVYAHRRLIGPSPLEGPWEWIPEGEEWADLASLGLLRLRQQVRTPAALGLPPDSWRTNDVHLSDRLWRAGHRVHVHWPEARHHHDG